jgi:hypothetical protein
MLHELQGRQIMPAATAASLADAPVWVQVTVATLGSLGGAGVLKILAQHMWPSVVEEADAEATLASADATRTAEDRMTAKDIQEFALKLMDAQHKRDQDTYELWKNRAATAEARADRLEKQLKVALDKIGELEIRLKSHELIRDLTDHGNNDSDPEGS